MREPLSVAVAQLDSRPGDVATNVAAVCEAAVEAAADMLITPELSLTGYDLRDAAVSIARPLEPGGCLEGQFSPLATAPGLVSVGLVERGLDEVPYNSQVLLEAGQVRHIHRKPGMISGAMTG